MSRPTKSEQDIYVCSSCGSEKIICRRKTDFCEKWCREDNGDDIT